MSGGVKIRSAGAILALLTLLNFLNYVDRILVSAVAPAFRDKLNLSNFTVGLVNSAFMFGYFLTSPLFGLVGDRPNESGRPIRTWLISLGVAVWSVATALSGLARSGIALIGARIGVGVGEASYATLSPTIIDDLAPEGKSNRWLAIFYLAIPVGSALGFLLGGMLEEHFGWRAAFFICGGPGILLSIITLWIAEPARKKKAEDAAKFSASHAIGSLLRAPMFVVATAGYCAYTFALGGFAAWAPTFLHDVHGAKLAEADFKFGVVAVLAGLIGTFAGAWLADRGLDEHSSEEARVRRYLRFSGWATALAAPLAGYAIFARSANAFYASIFVVEMLLFASTSPIAVVTLGAVPKSLRATAMAASIFAIHAFGDLISPPLVGLLRDQSNWRPAMAILPVAIAASALLWVRGARAPLERSA
jgi:MFS family permease